MPFVCAVPTSLPPTPSGAPIPSAGPYYIAQGDPLTQLTVLPNPNYTGARPHRFDSIEYTIGLPVEEIRQRIESGVSDYSSVPDARPERRARAALRAGQPGCRPRAPAVVLARGSMRLVPRAEHGTHALLRPEHAQGGQLRLDRTAMVGFSGPTALRTTDQYLPQGMPGHSKPRHLPRPSRTSSGLGSSPTGSRETHCVPPCSTTATRNRDRSARRTSGSSCSRSESTRPWSAGPALRSTSTWAIAASLSTSARRAGARTSTTPGTSSSSSTGRRFRTRTTTTSPTSTTRSSTSGCTRRAELMGDPRYEAFADIETDLEQDAAPWAA